MKDYLTEKFLGRALRQHLPIICMLITFLLIECFLFHYHAFPLASAETDGIGYMHRATGPIFQANPFHGPGYSLAIRLVHSLGLDLFSSAKVVSIVFGLIFVLAAWLILSSFSTSQEATLATVIIVFNPITLVRSVTIMSDMMAASLFLSTLALLIAPKEVKRWHFIFAGVLAGLAYLTRYVYIILFAVPPMLWLFCAPQREKQFKTLTHLVTFSLGFLLITLPWFTYMYQTKGNPLWNEHYRNVAFKMYRDGRGWNAFPSADQYRGWSDVFLSNPSLFIKKWLETILDLPWKILDLIPQVGIIGSVGFFFWVAKLDWRKAVYLLINVLYGFVVSLVWLYDRFLLPFIPLVASCVMSGLFAIPSSIASSGFPTPIRGLIRRIPLRIVAVSVFIVLLVFPSVGKISIYFSDQAFEYKAAADWLASSASKEVSVMASKPHIAFFSKSRAIDFRHYGLQNAGIEDLPDVLARAKPTYFVYDERYAAVAFPQFRVLLNPHSNPYPELLNPVFEVDSPMKLIVYKYNP